MLSRWADPAHIGLAVAQGAGAAGCSFGSRDLCAEAVSRPLLTPAGAATAAC